MDVPEGIDLVTTGRSFSALNTELLLREIRRCIPFVRGELLDVGCGDVPYREMVSSVVSQYVGVDTVRRSKWVTCCCSALALSFLASRFDTVLCTEVLEHIPHPKAVLSEIHRVLRPGGYLILSVPQMYWVHDAPFDFYRFTRYGLAELLGEQGRFETVYEAAVGNMLDAVIDVLSKALYVWLIDGPLPSRTVHRLVTAFQRVYLSCRNDHTVDDRFAMGHVVVARKR